MNTHPPTTQPPLLSSAVAAKPSPASSVSHILRSLPVITTTLRGCWPASKFTLREIKRHFTCAAESQFYLSDRGRSDVGGVGFTPRLLILTSFYYLIKILYVSGIFILLNLIT